MYNKFVCNRQQHEADIMLEGNEKKKKKYGQQDHTGRRFLDDRRRGGQTLIRFARFTFTHGAALPGHLHGVHAALPTGRGHAVRFSVDALAEGTVVFPPPVPVGADLAIGVAASRVVVRIDGIYGRNRSSE